MTLRQGDRVPHFDVASLDGQRIGYADFWQQKNLVLLSLPDEGSAAYAARLRESLQPFDDVACVVTRDAIAGVPHPGLVIADKWGEIYMITGASRGEQLPDPAEIVSWMNFVRHECPECQGEAL